MLETEIKKLTAAVTELTAAITAGAATPSAPAPTAAPSAPAPEPVAEPAAGEAPATEAPASPAVEVDKKTLTEKFIELAQAKGREVASQLLAEFKVTKLPELKDKAQWPAFYAKCNELLK